MIIDKIIDAFQSILKKDEDAIIYPTYVPVGSEFIEFTVHLHVFEREQNSISRLALITGLENALNITGDHWKSITFRERFRHFLVDNERRKRLKVRICGKVFTLENTGANGHSYTRIKIPASDISREDYQNGYITVSIPPGRKNVNRYEGQVYLIEQPGYCVISDIDDTIKDSDVRNKKNLLENTFYKTFKSIPGMNSLYKFIKARLNAQFFYVTSSPWQLYRELSDFFLNEGFPGGIYVMKHFRIKDSDFFNLFSSPIEYKTSAIEEILQTLPLNKFILIGDSGEKDPEAYAGLLRKYPHQIDKIFIRKAYPENEDARFQSVFAGISRDKWAVFENPEEIKKIIS